MQNVKQYIIGVDVGGTNTDAVLLCDGFMVHYAKSSTTDNVVDGIKNAITQLLSEIESFDNDQVCSVMIGTTHLLNALLQEKDLERVLVLRLAAPATTAAIPGIGWKESLRQAVIQDSSHIVRGGYEFDGSLIAEVDADEVAQHAQAARQQSIYAVAVTGVFSHVRHDQEHYVRDLLLAYDTKFNISLSHELGQLGLLLRENATILNASLSGVFSRLKNAITDAIDTLGFHHATLYLSNSTGTLQPLLRNGAQDQAKPILTLNSGPTNSIRGAGVVANLNDAIVIDVGGTSTDVGILQNQFPVMENAAFHVTEESRITCHFAKPRIQSIALGGGSIIDVVAGVLKVGPQSVASHLQQQALCFGGEQFTLTDFAVLRSRMQLDHMTRSSEQIQQLLRERFAIDTEALLQQVDNLIHDRLVTLTKDVMGSIEQLPNSMVLVGGGASLFDVNRLQQAFSQPYDIIIPKGAEIANAAGTAIAQTSVQISQLYDYAKLPRHLAIYHSVLQGIRKLAQRKVVIESIHIGGAGLIETPLNYLSGDPHQLDVTLVATLDFVTETALLEIDMQRQAIVILRAIGMEVTEQHLAVFDVQQPRQFISKAQQLPTGLANELLVQAPIVARRDMPTTRLDQQAVADIALGAGFLGSGGGGSPELGCKIAQSLIDQGGAVHQVSLAQLPDDAVVAAVGVMGSPIVLSERLPSLEEGQQAIQVLEQQLGKPIDAIVLMEGGGTNATYPLFIAAKLGIAVVDADCMGRAFPGIDMVTPNIYGNFTSFIAAISNCSGVKVLTASSAALMEAEARRVTVAQGGIVTLAYLLMTGAKLKQCCMPNTMRIAQQMGAAFRQANAAAQDKIAAINRVLSKTDYQGISIVAKGRVINLMRKEAAGFSVGGVLLKSDDAVVYEVGFQNENLFVRQHAQQTYLVCVPDLVILADANTLLPVSCEELAYGQRLVLLKITAPSKLKTKPALSVLGPAAYQLEQIDSLLQAR